MRKRYFSARQHAFARDLKDELPSQLGQAPQVEVKERVIDEASATWSAAPNGVEIHRFSVAQ